MSVAAQSLMDNVTYEDLYKRWEHGNWSAYDIDFSADLAGWDGLSDIQRRSAMWIYSMFFYGEDRVADTLAPYITAAPTEEQSYFLATQQVDEVRHSVFFHRFFKEVIGVDGDSLQADARLDPAAAQLGLPRDLRPPRRDGRGTAQGPLAAQVRAGDHPLPPDRRGQPGAARPALHRGLPRLRRHDARLQRRHGERLQGRAAPHRLRRQSPLRTARRGEPGWEENRAAVVELLRETLPYGVAVFTPPNWDREYTECYGFRLEDIFAFGLKLIRQRWRTIGFPTEEMPPGVFPFDHDMTEEEIADNQVKLLEAGVVGEPGVVEPQSSPELQRIFFDIVARSPTRPPPTAPPLVYQWRFSDAEPWHVVVDNGSTRAEPGEAPNANVTFETSWADWVALDPARGAARSNRCCGARSNPAARSASWCGCAASSPDSPP